MINREQFAQEMMLREQIRKAIRIVANRQKAAKLNEQKEEIELRGIIRSLLMEKNAVATTAVHDNTGINSLEDLLKNTNLLSVLSKGYKSLTSHEEQRQSYSDHILNAVETSLAPEEERKESDEDITSEEEIELEEAVDIDIDTDRPTPADDPDFIDVESEEVIKSDGEVEKEEFAIAGKDKTGRNKAFTDFKNVEKNILTAFDDLDDPIDREMFESYLLKNLHLYFEKWEDEIATNVEPPAAAEEEGEVMSPPLEESVRIDLENLIECLK